MKEECIVYKLTDCMPQSSKWDAAKMGLCHVATKCMQPHESILDSSLHMRLYRNASSDSLIRVLHATGTDSTSVICQVTIVLFIRHLFNRELKKQVAGAIIIRLQGML